MRHHLQPQIRSPGSKKEPGETVAVGIFPPDEAEDYARMQDVAVQMEMMFFRAKILMHSQK